MPSGASSGAPYFNGWSPYGGFAQPQQGYGMSSPFGGFGGGYGMLSPFGGFGGGYGMPFQQMPMGGGKGGYSSPFGQFQTPNFAAKGGTTQPQSSSPPSTMQSPAPSQTPAGNTIPIAPTPTNQPMTGPFTPLGGYGVPGGPAGPAPGTSNLIGHATGLPPTAPYSGQPAPVGAPPPNLGGGNYGQNPFGGLPTNMFSGSGTGPAAVPQPQPAPIPQAVPPQMMSPVSGPTQMLPQQMFNQTRIPGANSVLPGRNMLIGGYR